MTPALEASSPKRSWDTVSTFYHNCKIVTPRPKAAAFHLFPSLPFEIRLQIWAHAIALPRLVILENRWPASDSPKRRLGYPPGYGGFDYYNKVPPPMLSTCRDARIESLRAYESSNCISGPLWIRFDCDIVHMKNFSFSHQESKYNSRRGSRLNFTSDSWSGRPSPFEHIRCLAIHRELQLQNELRTGNGLERTIRHFFPNLELLVILIDDTWDIDKVWQVEKQNYRLYEAGNKKTLRTRQEFLEADIDSLHDCKVNRNYERFILVGLRKGYDHLDRHYSYKSPLTIIMGTTSPLTPGFRKHIR